MYVCSAPALHANLNSTQKAKILIWLEQSGKPVRQTLIRVT